MGDDGSQVQIAILPSVGAAVRSIPAVDWRALGAKYVSACAWCGRVRGADGQYGPPPAEGFAAGTRISHGICTECDLVEQTREHIADLAAVASTRPVDRRVAELRRAIEACTRSLGELITAVRVERDTSATILASQAQRIRDLEQWHGVVEVARLDRESGGGR